jgi:hypothetical protein
VTKKGGSCTVGQPHVHLVAWPKGPQPEERCRALVVIDVSENDCRTHLARRWTQPEPTWLLIVGWQPVPNGPSSRMACLTKPGRFDGRRRGRSFRWCRDWCLCGFTGRRRRPRPRCRSCWVSQWSLAAEPAYGEESCADEHQHDGCYTPVPPVAHAIGGLIEVRHSSSSVSHR